MQADVVPIVFLTDPQLVLCVFLARMMFTGGWIAFQLHFHYPSNQV